jgi:uncharacterized membrane protein YgcG
VIDEPDASQAGAEEPTPSEEEMRAALEEQMRQIRVEDLLLQSVASIVNLTARRIAKPDERDLGQAKVGIDAVAALVSLLPEEAAKQVRNALSELRVLYAQTAGDGGEAPEGGAEEPGGGGGGPSGGGPQPPPAPGPRSEPPPRLWTPGS